MNALTHIALAGTAKVATDPKTGTPLDGIFGALPGVERERALLLRVASEATYALAGRIAEPGVTQPEPARDEHQKVCSATVARLVGDLLQQQHAQVLPEALRLLAEANLRLPPTLLPIVLSLRAHDLRPAVRLVIGERGRWLSRFNPEWAWATEKGFDAGAGLPSNAETLWQEGTQTQRLAILERVRAEDPALARAWLEAVWRAEKAEFRNQALELLEHGLSRDDEPFLEKALDDRAPTVRARVAALLATLPDSGLVTRMRERVDGLLRYTPAAPTGRLRGLLRSVLATPDSSGTLSVALPETFDQSWQRDGILEKPLSGIGQRSWWLIQLLALIPPTHWENSFKVSPHALISSAVVDDMARELLTGWSRATILHRATDWALPLWNAWDKADEKDSNYTHVRIEMLGALMHHIPEREARNLAVQVLKRKDLSGQLRDAILQVLPRPWDVDFSNVYLDLAHKDSKANTWGIWHQTFSHAAIALPPACFERALRLFTPGDDQTANWYVRAFLDTIQMRQRIYEEIRP